MAHAAAVWLPEPARIGRRPWQRTRIAGRSAAMSGAGPGPSRGRPGSVPSRRHLLARFDRAGSTRQPKNNRIPGASASSRCAVPKSGALPSGRRSSTASPRARADGRSCARCQLVTKSKGGRRQTLVMNAPHRLSPNARDRAVDRVRTLTVGTALASAAAVAVFGTVAAISHPGNQSASTAATGTTAGSTTSSTSTSSTSSSSTDSSTTLQPAPTAATTTSGRGQVTTGAS